MKAFNRYDLNDVYLIVNAFIEKNYPNDEVIKSMVFIDYFNFYKIKPKDIFNATIILKQNNFNNNAELNFHKFRYAFIPVQFNPIIWFKENKIVAKKDMVIFKYDGRLKPEILYSKRAY